MIETINMLLLKKFEDSQDQHQSTDFINQWLLNGQNYQRLQSECDKIWSHLFEDERYDTERAFKLLGQRLSGVCKQEII